jgi:hypothetical protein
MIISDTRIPPQGFVAEIATKPTPEIDYGHPAAGFRHYDEASFTLILPAGATGSSILSARVYYQPITRKYVEHLAAFNVTDSSGQELLATYEALGASPPFLVAKQDRTILIGQADQSASG